MSQSVENNVLVNKLSICVKQNIQIMLNFTMHFKVLTSDKGET